MTYQCIRCAAEVEGEPPTGDVLLCEKCRLEINLAQKKESPASKVN